MQCAIQLCMICCVYRCEKPKPCFNVQRIQLDRVLHYSMVHGMFYWWDASMLVAWHESVKTLQQPKVTWQLLMDWHQWRNYMEYSAHISVSHYITDQLMGHKWPVNEWSSLVHINFAQTLLSNFNDTRTIVGWPPCQWRAWNNKSKYVTWINEKYKVTAIKQNTTKPRGYYMGIFVYSWSDMVTTGQTTNILGELFVLWQNLF